MQLPYSNIHTDQPNQQALFPDYFEVSVAPVNLNSRKKCNHGRHKSMK